MTAWIKSIAIPFVYIIGKWLWDGFTVTVHVDPAIALVGKGVMLSCQPVGHNPAKIQVHWYKWERSKNTTLYFYNSTENGIELGQAGDQNKSDAPRGRYENGVVRVKLFPVQVEDSGQYVCAVTNNGVYQEAIAQVIVAGFGSAPRLTIEHQQNNSITLRCSSQGWYPQPEVCWTDSMGQNITAMAETRIQKDVTDLYQIHSTLRVADIASDTISCTLRNPLLKRHLKEVIAISGIGNETSLQMHHQKVCQYECKWKGWYPKPMIFWRNHKGQSINSLAETTEVQDEQNLFTVASAIAVSCGTPEVACAIVNTESEMIQQSTAQHFVGFLICLLLFIAVTVEHFFGKCKSQFQNVIDQVQREREQSRNDYDRLRMEMDQLQRERVQFRNDCAQLQGEIDELQRQMGRHQVENTTLQPIIQQLQHENEELREKCEQLQHENNQVHRENDQLKKERGQFQVEKNIFQQKIQQLQLENEQVRWDRNQVQLERDELRMGRGKKQEHSEEEMKKYSFQLDELQRQNENLEQRIKKLKEEKAQLQEQKERKEDFPVAGQLQREIAQLKEEKGNLEKRIKELQEEEGDLEKRINEMKKELDWRRAQNNSDDISLHGVMAHPNISIADNKKSFTHEA
ncbi:uncharacterized protein LOC123350389 isoform X13 [Mauremys mutica]|uniref:uncharacterized protein LOC123350389 isoform X13 n=1 Tax=Mauremys mutica TaxID=74926 RepID=UPI001D16E72B|nr:uncharacterized protein LOC123350389 isoform X13 [Mauremys mutica]